MSEMFDRLAKLAAGGVSRRDALHYLGGFLAGGFLAALPSRARADDDHKHKDKDHDDDDDDDQNEEINEKCHKFCEKCPRRPAAVHGLCMAHCKRFLHKNPKGTLCGACTAKNPFTGCPSTATCCAATATAAAYCANLNTDANNCGKCGTKCSSGTTPGCCAGGCVDLSSDNNNCGACGTKCASGKTCTKGVCS
jgi:hypothetical protein